MSENSGLSRTEAKAQRRATLLGSAATLFAHRGFNGVSIEDLGAAAGVSGPAVYRHFSGKQALLGALLIDVSELLLAGGKKAIAQNSAPDTTLRALIAFHVDFALTQPDVIRVQDRDFDSLSKDDRTTVRSLQRAYVELWVEVLGRLKPSTEGSILRLTAHALFGLINSTPHSLQIHGKRISTSAARPVLEEMAWGSLQLPSGN